MSNGKRTRNNRVWVRLTDDEFDYLRYNVERTSLSREAYLRQIIADRIPKTKEVGSFEQDCLAALNAIGNNLNQIARRAHSMHVLSVEHYDDVVKDFQKVMKQLSEKWG